MSVKNKKIVLTGGAGFIGSAIVGRLIENNEIVVYDTLQRNSLKDRDFLNHKNLTLVQGSVLDQEKLKEVIGGSNIVIHLAAIAGVDNVIKHPVETMKVNVLGTYNVLEASKASGGLERFINFSTSEVYGSYAYKLEEGAATSLGEVGDARWAYAISKLTGDNFAINYHREFDLPVTSMRPFNIYGPGQVGEGAIHKFVIQALKNEDLTIHGDGDQIRSWCYIDDIVDAIVACLEKREAVGNIFNIGNPKGTITILGLAEKIIGLCKSDSKINFSPKMYTDVELRIPNIGKAKDVLGYRPKVDLNEGLRRTIKWYSKMINLKNSGDKC